MKSLPPVALVLALLSGTLLADTIRLRDGTSLDGVTVTAETMRQVEYRKSAGGTPQSVKSADVASIDYGATPTDMQVAVVSREEGDLGTAALHFLAVADDKGNAAFLRALAQAEAGDCQLADGEPEAAGKTYAQLLDRFPDSRQYPRGLLGRGRVALGNGRVDEAAKAFAQLKAESASKGLGEAWGLRAELWALRVPEAQGLPDKLKEALAGYEALRARATGANRDVALQCALRMGRVHLNGNAVDKALPLFEEAIAGRDVLPREDAASAFNGRGRCLVARAQAAGSEANALAAKGSSADAARAASEAAWRAARFDFLRVFVSFQDVPEQQPEALYGAAQCFQNIADGDSQAAGLAAALLKRCRELYPGSPWAAKAAQG